MPFTDSDSTPKTIIERAEKQIKDMFFISQGSFCKNIMVFYKNLYESFYHFVQKILFFVQKTAKIHVLYTNNSSSFS